MNWFEKRKNKYLKKKNAHECNEWMVKIINGMTSAYILKINREQPKKEQRSPINVQSQNLDGKIRYYLLIQQSNQKNTVCGLFA